MSRDTSRTTPTDAERADTLMAAIEYAIEHPGDGIVWLRAWVEGDRDIMDELAFWREARVNG